MNVVNWHNGIKVVLLLVILSACLLGYALHCQSSVFSEIQAAWLSADWMLLVCVALWCGTFIFLTFSLNDLPLIGLLLIAIAAYFIGFAVSQPAVDAIILLAGVTMGRGVRLYLNRFRQCFITSLVILLAFSSWWHLDVAHDFYPGTRWTGLWNNPNDYGMLMSVGVLLAVGLLADRSWKMEDEENFRSQDQAGKRLNRFSHFFAAVKSAILLVAAGMMMVGLTMSYSRGAWLGTVIGLLYLAKHRKAESGTRLHSTSARQERKAKIIWYVLPLLVLAVVVVCYFWHNTSDDAPWYLKRADLSRPSAQHRFAAWKAGFEIMRDHPFGVGWNKAVETYEKNYSSPENGAAAITTNDYLMLGTELGIPALVCFIAYVFLRFKTQPETGETRCLALACRAAFIAMLVEFWFDGGLFKLATASVFWILLELGAASPRHFVLEKSKISVSKESP